MIRPVALGLLALLALGAPAVASAAPQPPVAEQLDRQFDRQLDRQFDRPPTVPRTASPAEAAGYAQRERDDPQVANYEGGNVVVISLSGSALIVLFLLLLLI